MSPTFKSFLWWTGIAAVILIFAAGISWSDYNLNREPACYATNHHTFTLWSDVNWHPGLSEHHPFQFRKCEVCGLS